MSHAVDNPCQSITKDTMAYLVFGLLAFSAVVLLILIVVFLVQQAWPLLASGKLLNFLSAEGWHPLEGKLGMLPMLWATLASAIGALFIALPLGMAVAVFSLYIAPKFLKPIIILVVNLLAGIPSVVFGLWGLTWLVPLLNEWHAPGASLLAAILVLSVMILPTITITTRTALAALPASYQQAAACLCLSRTTVIIEILIPAASRGIGSGVLLALARALGETMAVLMVAGNVVQTPHSLFDPVRVLTANIALEMAYAADQHRAALFASGLLLMLLVSCTLIFAILMRRKREEQ